MILPHGVPLTYRVGKPGKVRRHVPFVSSNLQDYINQYWAVMFISGGAGATDAARLRHYVNWYCTRAKAIDVDHHTAGRSLIQQIRSHGEHLRLPVLFVNKKLIGTLDDVMRLEEQRKLKDVLQFGFEWRTNPTPCGPLPSGYGDKELFLGTYRGAPPQKPIMQLPKLHPHISQDSSSL